MLIPDIDVFKQDAVQVLGAVQIIGCALGGGYEHFAVGFQPLFVERDLDRISAEAVYCVDEHDFPCGILAVFQHLLKRRSVVIGAGGSTVYVCVHHDEIVRFGILCADMKLSFYGLLLYRA